MRKVVGVLAVAVLAGLVLASCASDSGSSNGSSDSGSTTPPVTLTGDVKDHGKKDIAGDGMSPKLSMQADDAYFEPTYVKAAPSATVSVTVKNAGKLDHNFSVDGQPIDVDLAPGASKTVQVKIPADGGLRFFCRIHQGSGMQGAFYTTEGVTVSSGSGSGGSGSTGTGTGSSPGY